MTNELQTLEQRIADKVGHELVGLLPPEQWQAIIDAQVHKFRTEVAPKIIQEEITQHLRERIRNHLQNEYLSGDSKYNQEVGIWINDQVIKLMIEAGSEAIGHALAPIGQEVMQQLINSLNRGY